jgi:hypothetical protein
LSLYYFLLYDIILLQMINLEKQVASESVDEDFLNISTLIDSDHEMEEEEEERNQRQQAKKIVEVDNVIVEKEEILKKLLDTVRGYSAMKVFTFMPFSYPFPPYAYPHTHSIHMRRCYKT